MSEETEHLWMGVPVPGVPLHYREKITWFVKAFAPDGEGLRVINVNHNYPGATRRSRADLPAGLRAEAIMIEVRHEPSCLCFRVGPVGASPGEVMFGCDCDPDLSIVEPLG